MLIAANINYGGRGIKICDRWRDVVHGFENFLADLGLRPDKCSLDRIDNDGNYEPENCRWATIKQQNRNKRSNFLVTIKGVTKTIAEWSEISGLKYYAIWHRVKKGWHECLLLTKSNRGLSIKRRQNLEDNS